MAEHRQFRYAHDVNASAFSRELSARVEAYFEERGISRHANLEMYAKTVLGLGLTVAVYAWLMTGRFTALEVIGVYVLLGAAQLYCCFNIAHDGNHSAYSNKKWVNRAAGCVFDAIGVSSYMWRLLHNTAHHSFVNIRGADTTLVSGNVFRFTPHDQRRPFHRFQHLYAPLLYCLSSLDWVLTKDFRWLLADKSFGNRRQVQHPTSELIVLFAFKVFYYTYVLVLPLLLLDVPWWSIVGGFVAMHLCAGFVIAVIFQPNHFNEEATYPEADAEGHIGNNYIQHVFDTTSDYANHPVKNWILGGLNLHVVHHMFPTVCHVHYPALTRIIKATAEEYGLRYRETRTITGAFLAHLRWLKVLGNAASLVLLAAAWSASAAPIALPRPNEKWTTLQVDELTFVSSVSASETVEIARDLLRMREAAGRITNLNVRSSKPMRVILFASEEAFAPYREAIASVDHPNVRGVFTGSDSVHFIVMVHDGAHPIERTVYHELTHYFLRNSVDGIPPWAHEGAAEYYSTFRSSGDAVQVGHPILEHLQTLRSEPLLPLRKLLATTVESPHYKRTKQGLFYAQSWALFHYLMNDDARRAGLRTYLSLVGEGKPVDDAFTKAFDRSYDAMQRELGAYVGGKTFVVREYPLSDLVVPDVPKPRPLTRAALLFELGHLLVHATKPVPAVAKRMLEEALALEPELAGAHADLGRLHDIAARRREAETAYARALALGSDDPLVYLVVGNSTLERSQTVAGADSVAAVLQARKAFERAAQLDPRSAIAWANIGATYAMSAEDPAPGIAALEKSLAMGFDDANAALNLVRLYTRVDRRAEAQRLIDTLLTRTGTPEQLAFARDLLVLAEVEQFNAKGKTAEAAQLARELAGRTKEATLKAHLEMRIEQFDQVTNYNRAVYALGDAVAKSNAGQPVEALAIVDRVLAETTDPALVNEARRLRAEFERKAKLKR